MNHTPILSILTFLPIAGALVVMLSKILKVSDNFNKIVALIFSLATMLLSGLLFYMFDKETGVMQFAEKILWFDDYNIYYSMGVDAISLYLIMLTTFLVPMCIISSWHHIKKQVSTFMLLFLLLEGLIIGTFCATSMVLFYLFFESVLIPMFIIIGIWGAEDKIYAAYKFFLYTMFGSVFMLLAIVYIYYSTGTSDMAELLRILPKQPLTIQKMLWWAFFLSFAVKMPMWPFHTWLSDAHVQAPTAGSVILAGVLLKLGGYGFLRLSLPMLPMASMHYAHLIFYLSIISVIYTSLVALVQTNIKKLIAYSSVAHMGFVTAGIFSGNIQGLQGAVFQMVSHGLVSAALFLCVGVIYERMHSKDISFYNGLANRMPRYALIFIFLSMASIGLPGTSGFIGEFIVLLAVFQEDRMCGFLLALGMVLGAVYMLWLVARVIFGELENSKLNGIMDLTWIEKTVLYPIVITTLLIGIYPKIITDPLNKSMEKILTIIDSDNSYMLDNLD